MSQFSIIGTPLYQWEIGRQLKVIPLRGMRVDSVHFSNYGDSEALVVKPKDENGQIIADIPNILLQDDRNIVVHSVNVSEDKVETIQECVFPVRKRAKPSSYVYTETEVLNYSYLDDRLKHLEGEGLADAVADYFEKNPPESNTIVPETAVEHNGLLDGIGYEDIVPGKKYAVIIDGVPYVTTCKQVGEGELAWAYIGNLAVNKPADPKYDTGEPFFGSIIRNLTHMIFADGASHKVAIYKLNELDEAIVNTMKTGEAFVIRGNYDGLDKTNAEIYEAYLQNRPIYGVYVGENADSIFYPVVISEDYALFVNNYIDYSVYITYNRGVISVKEIEPGGGSGGNATNGIPKGGKAGQYLCKQSDNDYDVVWCDLVIPEQYGLVTYDQDKTITIT